MNEQEQELLEKIFSLSRKIGQWNIVWDDLNKADFIYGCYYDKDFATYNVYVNEERGVHILYLTTPNKLEALEKLYSIVEARAHIIQMASEQDEQERNLIKSTVLYSKIQKNVLKGVKVPHSTSQPVIRLMDGQYYLAVFVFYYSKEDIELEMVSRPEVWALADLDTGEIIHEYSCKEKDFSDANYNRKYNIHMDRECNTSKQYYDLTFALLDIVRSKIRRTGKISFGTYREYMERILVNIPDDYQKFYWDLSI